MINKIALMLNIALFPFKDLTFYNLDILTCKNKEGTFIDDFYRNILSKCKFNSIDEINLILKKYYPFLFNENLKSDINEKYIFNHCFSILEKFSAALLSHRDGEIVYKYWKNSKDDEFLGPYSKLDKVHIFNIISRCISMDILVATYYSINGIDDVIQLNGFYQHINLVDAPLHNVLLKGVSENHIHATAAFNFTTLWILAMNNKIGKDYFDKIKANKIKISSYAISNKVKEYLLTAEILRIVLSQFLNDKINNNVPNWFKTLFNDLDNTNYQNTIICDILNSTNKDFLDSDILLEIIEELKIHFQLNDGDREKDIIFSIFKKDSCIKTYGENILLHYALKYKKLAMNLNEENNDYVQFCRIFFKYISIKNEFYQQVTQSNSIKGLDFFQKYFARATRGFDVKNHNYCTRMLRTLFQNSYLKKIELRTSLVNNIEENKKNIKEILIAYKTVLEEDYKIKTNTNVDFPRIAIIYHLIKKTDNIEKCWCIYDEKDKILKDKLYYKKNQDEYFHLIENMINLRNKIPYLANFIVGIDAASLENNTPIQVFAPIFEKARNSNCDNFLIKDKNGFLVKNQSLFFTFHAGEDFRHINSGLRRIDEVINFCKFHAGDRIGHAIALGVDIEKWCKRNPIVIIPRGEYLDNLLWIWGVYSKNLNFNSRVYVYLEQKIYNIAKEIFQNTNGLTTSVLYDTYIKRFGILKVEETYKMNEDEEEKCIYSFCKKVSDKHSLYWDSKKLHHAYHCKCYLEKLTEPIYINTGDVEEIITKEMQNYLRKKIAQKGIVIEVNPTSNFAIGEVENMYDSQFFKFNSPNDESLKNILININSDDPMVFNTNISNEIAYLYYGMLEHGIGEETALKWIEKIRKCGMDTSFIRSNQSNQEYIDSLYALIDALEDPLYC